MNALWLCLLLGQTPTQVQPDGLLICEAEDFSIAKPGWQAKNWGENYYAATFANSFLSRKAYLAADEQADGATATMKVNVPAAGKYHVLVRYEAAYRFETQFRVVVDQGGVKLDRLYGARDNVKIWAFSQKLKKEIAWDWGAGENIVWEGHDAFVELQPGEATITLVANKQPGLAAKRNIDLVMLTTDEKQVAERIEKENYLPLDGMLTQSGDVFLRVTNTGDKLLKFGGGQWTEHSPYWVHQRKWKPVTVDVEPGKTSAWIEVGGTMDTLNDGGWTWSGDGKYKAEFAIKSQAGEPEKFAEFNGDAGTLTLAAEADTRRSKRLRTVDRVLYDLLDELKKQPMHGKAPEKTLIYASTFTPLANDPKHQAAVLEFKKLFGLADSDGGKTYIDVRGIATDKLAEACLAFGAEAKDIRVVSLGDEISLPAPAKGAATDSAFKKWLEAQGVTPANLGLPAEQVVFNPDVALKETQPGLFYWSQRYLYHAGIQGLKQRTDILKKHLPNAGIGANYSPHYPTEHMFLGETHKWVTAFREQGMTMPWGEDYIWQVPVGSPQMNNINLDLFRAGVRDRDDAKIMYYVMPHAPNNTPRMWRRLFFGAVGHGMKIVNLFEFRPVQVAYTENHVSDPAMYAAILRGFRELGLFEDIVQTGKVRRGDVGLWFNETGDIWGDSHGSFAAGKRSLYLAIRQQQAQLDVLTDSDFKGDTFGKYNTLYLTDRHVSRDASGKIAAWVRAGGTLFATAGAGLRDEYNQPNEILAGLLGVTEDALEQPEGKQVKFEKQDLAFVEPIDKVGDAPVIGVKSRVKLAGGEAKRTFSDGSPAVVENKAEKGRTIYCAFLPGLSYLQPALPKRPFDRGATDDALVHFLPTDVNVAAAEIIRSAIKDPPLIECSNPLVEATLIESSVGAAIPLVNWTPKPISGLKVILRRGTPKKEVTLASGGKVEMKEEGKDLVLTLDLDTADAIVLR